MVKIRWRPELIVLIIAAFVTRLWSLFTPNAVVFDEVYFKAFASHYLDGRYFFDIHPPLGKLLLALTALLFHLSPSAMQSGTAVQLRLLPAIAGALLIPTVWALLRRLGASRVFAFLGAFCVLLDGALLVESRFILVDSMLILFGVLAVYLYLVYRDTHTRMSWLWLALSALFAGASVSTKWTGLNAIAIILVVRFWDSRHNIAPSLKRTAELAVLLLIPILLYISVFWIHFQLLSHSGDGDAFMTPKFQSTLIGSPYYNPHARMSFAAKFIELNKEMFLANQSLTATHPYGSHWYMWPLEIRPIYYWEGSVLSNGTQGNIYLLGNPAVWWGIWIAIFSGFSYVFATRHKLSSSTIAGLSLCAAAFIINFAPFITITRIMFLYHYLFALIYSLCFAILLWNDIARHRIGREPKQRKPTILFAAVCLIIALTFIYFIPISYGTPLSPTQLEQHMWLRSWR
jgi:dolichyl-phosphate-mannose-protein mannosyltransferase